MMSYHNINSSTGTGTGTGTVPHAAGKHVQTHMQCQIFDLHLFMCCNHSHIKYIKRTNFYLGVKRIQSKIICHLIVDKEI